MNNDEPVFQIHRKRGPKSPESRAKSQANLIHGRKFTSTNQPRKHSSGPRKKRLALPMVIEGKDIIIGNFRELTEVCRTHAPEAIAVLHGAMLSPDTALALRIDIAKWLIERGYGKPPLPLILPVDETASKARPVIETDMKEFAREALKIINQQDRRKTDDGETSGESDGDGPVIIVSATNTSGDDAQPQEQPDDGSEVDL